MEKLVKIENYAEVQPHRLKRIIWYVINITIFPCLGCRGRCFLLRCFGAQIERLLIYRSARVYAPWNLKVGDWTCIGPRVEIYNKDRVEIGSGVVISQDVYLCTASHDVTSSSMLLVTHPIVIRDQAWVAAKATVLPGVIVGEGGVIGACSVVTKDVSNWSVVAGNPARVVKKRVIHS